MTISIYSGSVANAGRLLGRMERGFLRQERGDDLRDGEGDRVGLCSDEVGCWIFFWSGMDINAIGVDI
jgi:hypothetical protein